MEMLSFFALPSKTVIHCSTQLSPRPFLKRCNLLCPGVYPHFKANLLQGLGDLVPTPASLYQGRAGYFLADRKDNTEMGE